MESSFLIVLLLVIKYYIPLFNLFLRFIVVPNLRRTITVNVDISEYENRTLLGKKDTKVIHFLKSRVSLVLRRMRCFVLVMTSRD